MIIKTAFHYIPSEDESESASNSYLMSLVAIVAGLPLPIINLIATFIFYMSNRKSTYFVRWHCMQALLSQFSLLFINSFGFWWTVSIISTEESISTPYLSYIAVILIFNLIEFITTIYTAIQTRKGHHVTWWFYGTLSDLLVKQNK
jgi:uncharacterized membrane protein